MVCFIQPIPQKYLIVLKSQSNNNFSNNCKILQRHFPNIFSQVCILPRVKCLSVHSVDVVLCVFPRSARPASHSTVDPDELRRFQSLAGRWWDEQGEFAALHAMNDLRVPFIRCVCLDTIFPLAFQYSLYFLKCQKDVTSGSVSTQGNDWRRRRGNCVKT